MRITRRTLLAGSAAAGSTFGFEWFAPAAPVVEQSPLTAVREWSTFRFFNGDFSSEQLLRYPRLLELGPAKADTEISLRYDPRLFLPVERVQFSREPDMKTVGAAARLSQIDDGREKLAFTLPQGTGQSLLSLPLRRRSLYPFDNVAAPLPMDLTLAPRRGSKEVYRWGGGLESTPTVAWGAELRAAWKRVLGTRQLDSYSLPRFIRVRSVGPNPIPAGCSVQVDVDPFWAAEATVESAAISGATTPIYTTSTRKPNLLRLGVGMREAIPAGSVLELQLNLVPTVPSRSASAIRFSTVSFIAKEIGWRETGMLSSADLTPSGRQVAASIGSI